MRLGPMEIALLIILALIIFGGSRLAGIGKSLGANIRDFKKEMDKPDETKPLEAAKDAANTGDPETDKG